MESRDIPIVYVWIYRAVKRRAKGNLISTSVLKEWVKRTVIKNGGIPRILVYDIIKDMCNMNLIERIHNKRYKILPSKCEIRLKLSLT